MSFAASLMQAYAFGIFPKEPYHLHIIWKNFTLPTPTQKALGSLCLVGFVLLDLVYLAVVVAYVSQCHLVRKVVDARSNNIRNQQMGQIGLSPQEVIQVCSLGLMSYV